MSDTVARSAEPSTAPGIIRLLAERFTSLNPIPVERATIKRTEWAVLLKDIRDTGELGFHHGNERGCHSCEMVKAILEALERLK